jgi:hypothetical protein
MNAEQKKEIEQFEILQAKLTKALVEGYDHPNAQELGFFVAQAIRDVPTLLQLLEETDKHSNDEILDAVHMVVANHFALSEANRLLTSFSDLPT